MNLIEGLLSEMNRCRKLIVIYNTIPNGSFEAAMKADLFISMIKQDIVAAEEAMVSGDTVQMLRCYKALKECK